MTSFSHLSLEDFGSPTPDRPGAATTEAPPAGMDTTEVFEKGYQAGWDDCLEGAKRDQTHVAEALGKRLAEAQLSVDQARNDILAGLKPLLADIVQKLLPTLAREGFKHQLVDEVMNLAQNATQADIEVRVSQDDLSAVAALIEAHPDIPQVTLSADQALGLTQAHIKLGSTGRSIDILHVVDGIETAFDSVLSDQTPVTPLEEKDEFHG